MSVTTYVTGWALLALATVPMALGFRCLRRALLPTWSGPPAWILDVLACTALFVMAAQLTGVIGILSALSIGLVTAAAGLICWRASTRVTPSADALDPPVTVPSVLGPQVTRFFSVAVVAVAAAPWLARTSRGLRFGMGSIDTIWYHMPAAARFVQEGRITGMHPIDDGATIVFYPQNSGLFHAFGMSAFDADILSPLMSLGWFALALLAGWCIGRSRGVAPLTMAGTAVLLSTPIFVGTQPGTAYNDTLGLALTLGAVALLYTASSTTRLPPTLVLIVSAASLGVVLGTKWTTLIGIGALALGTLVLAPAGRRLRVAAIWVIGTVVTGAVWYVKSAVEVGNPVPPLGLHLGPLTISAVPEPTPTGRIVSFLFDAEAWRSNFLYGFDRAFGVVWPLFLLAVAAGLGGALVRPRRALDRVAGLVGAAVIVGYIVSPQFLVVFGRPAFFWANLRYPAIGLGLGLVLLPMTMPRRALRVVAAAFAVLLVGFQANETIWPWTLDDVAFSVPIESYAVLIGVAGGVALLAAGLLLTDRRARRFLTRTTAAVAILGLFGAGYAVARTYPDRWYAPRTVYDSALVNSDVYRWAQTVDGARIGIVGDTFQYPLSGSHQSNFVEYLTIRDEQGAPRPIEGCRAWRRAVNRGDYDYIVVAPPPLTTDVPPERGWTAPGPASRVVLANGPSTVFRITGRLDPDACPSPAG